MYDPMRNPYIAGCGSMALDEAGPRFELSRLAGSFGAGVKSGYESSKEFSQEELGFFESIKSKVMPYVEKAVEFCKGIDSFLKKWKVPTPLAVLAVAAVMSGAVAGGVAGAGAAASQVPMLALVYFVQRSVAGGAEWLMGMGHGARHESLSFADYCAARDLQEDYEGLYDLAGSVGRAAGTAAGTVSKYARGAYSLASKAVGAVGSTAARAFKGVVDSLRSNPKASAVSALKLAIVVAAAVLAGGAAAGAYKMLTSPDGWQQIGQAVASMGAGSAEEVVKELSSSAHDAAHSVAQGAHDAAHGVAHGAHDAAHGVAHGAHGAAHGHSAADQASHMAQHFARDAAIHGAGKAVGREMKHATAANIGLGVG